MEEEKKSVPIKAIFVEKRDDIDRSTLYSFDGAFQLLHADVGKLESLGKLAADPKYCLLFADLFTLKVYVYSIKSQKLIAAKIEFFYREVQQKRKGQKTRLQMDQDFKQKKIFDLIKKYNVNMFSTAVRCGKVFASEQKSKELKKGIFRLKVLREKD